MRRWAAVLATVAGGTLGAAAPAAASSQRAHIDCDESSLCAEVANPAEAFGAGYYVGHDEPSALFYSNQPGAGNHLRYTLTLPQDPSPNAPNTPGKSYNFELAPTFWLGMALCDTQSYPEQVSTCRPDSDSNITRSLAKHPGTAFTELQFYPPGWVPWPTWAVAPGATTCDPTRWCAAMNVFTLLEDPIHGTLQNPSCAAKVGIETFEFAFVTRNGRSLAPANPLDATLDTYTPDPRRMLLMNPNDRVRVTMHDTPDGLRAELDDLTSGQSGSMTASPANGFAQFEFAPTGTSCNAIPYAFHPMYSTSSERTRVPWAAHSYSVAFSEEIGHFQRCDGPNPIPASEFGLDAAGNPVTCPAGNTEDGGQPTDGDDDFCFPGSESLLVHVNGCTDSNTGFDGTSYRPVWPDGNTALHPTPVRFTSPLTGPHYDTNYTRAALEADLPRIEDTCDRTSGDGCTQIPTADDGAPALFYPYYSTTAGRQCQWQFGGAIPGSGRDFGAERQWGPLLSLTYLVFGGGGDTQQRFNDFRNVFRTNPCRA